MLICEEMHILPIVIQWAVNFPVPEKLLDQTQTDVTCVPTAFLNMLTMI